MPQEPILTILRVGPEQAGVFESFLRAAEGEAAVEAFRRGRAKHDLLDDPSFWLLLALAGQQPAGAAAVVLIPKWDERAGFLFVDELLVLPAFRRQGVATALLSQVEVLARERGLAGVRLLVRPENEAARRLYERFGFSLGSSTFCQKLVSAP